MSSSDSDSDYDITITHNETTYSINSNLLKAHSKKFRNLLNETTNFQDDFSDTAFKAFLNLVHNSFALPEIGRAHV